MKGCIFKHKQVQGKKKNTKGKKRRYFKFTLKKDLKVDTIRELCKLEAREGGVII